jgi:hypothetical protein
LQHKIELKDALADLKPAPGINQAEKNERIGRVLAMIAEAKNRYALSLRALAAEKGLGAATLIRRRRRLSCRQAAVGRRGLRNLRPLNQTDLTGRIQDLDHDRKRSRGSGAVHRADAGGISRRQLAVVVRAVREETARRRVAKTCQVRWLRPNLAWAMADFRRAGRTIDAKLHLHNLTELHSRYRLPPLSLCCLPCGEEASEHLQHLFDRFDPPLSLKRDNRRNLNHRQRILQTQNHGDSSGNVHFSRTNPN